MAPNLTATKAGALATWIEPTDATKTTHRVRFASFANGRWSPATTIAEARTIVANWADVPSVVQQGDGTLLAHWAEKSAPDVYAYDVMLARSDDGGRSWQALGRAHDDASPTEHGFVSLVPERDRTTAIWLDGRATPNGGPTALRARTIGKTPSAESVVDDRVCDCCSTHAAHVDDGPIVVYRDRSGDELRDIYVSRQVGGAWTAPQPVANDGWKIAGCPVNGPAVAASGRDVVVAWFTYAEQRARVRVAFSSDAGDSFGPPVDVEVPDGTRAPVGRVDVVLHERDAIVSWLASDREAGTVNVRRVARDGRLGRELAIARAAAGRESGFPRLSRLDNGQLLAIWTETSEPSRLRAVRIAIASMPAVEQRLQRVDAPPQAFAVGASAPEYRATTLTGAPVDLRSLRGTPVLLNVWATWCEPCRHELPILDRLRTRFAERGLRVIAASVDREEPREEIAAFVNRRELAMETWLDREDRASQLFGITTLPVTLLFDASGTLVWRQDGAITDPAPALEAAIERVLAR